MDHTVTSYGPKITIKGLYCLCLQDEGWEEEDGDEDDDVELSGQTLSSLIDQFAGDYQGKYTPAFMLSSHDYEILSGHKI